MNIARVIPETDEIAAGLLGRVGLSNGCPDLETTATGLRITMGMPQSASWLNGLAAYVGLAPTEFAWRHTLVPVTRAVSTHVGTSKEAEILASVLGTRNHVRRPNMTARHCPVCDREDEVAGRRGHWRRQHHLPMVDWCHRHRVALYEAPASAFTLWPTAAAQRSNDRRLDLNSDIKDGSVLARFAEIQLHWLKRREPLSSTAMNRIIQEGCRRNGLRHGQTGQRPLLSDMAREVVPTDWLGRHLPEVATKGPGTYLARIDGAAKDKHVAYPGPTCAFAVAVLFESAPEALALLDAENKEVLEGLRAKSRVSPTALADAGQAFLDGEAIGKVCSAYGVSVEDVANWVREDARRWRTTALAGQAIA